MKPLKANIFLMILLSIVIIIGYTFFFLQPLKIQTTNTSTQFYNYVVGLLSNNNSGSYFVVYDTEKWTYTRLLNLPDVSPDNYSAMSNDGNYIAYTKWDENYSRRYLQVYSNLDGTTKSFYQDLPIKNEIIKISWLPDNKTLVFIKNDATLSSYQQIQTLNIETEQEKTLVKGEVWRMRVSQHIGDTADDFYLKGHNAYLKVKEKKAVTSYNRKSTNSDFEWNYYLNQEDLNEIYQYYGGNGTFNIDDILNLMYVRFSAPRCSCDGTKIIYSTVLDRNSIKICELGEQKPTWMCASIWAYDIKSGQTSIIYSQQENGAIGRVEWVDHNEISFVSYYDFQGGRDCINYINLGTNEYRTLFSYTDANYNNVTLLPIGNRKITFTTSRKGETYKNSRIILFNLDSNATNIINLKFEDKSILLENFIFTKLSCNNFLKIKEPIICTKF